MKKPRKNITPEDIRQAQAATKTCGERASLLDISIPTYNKYCDLYGIPRKEKVVKEKKVKRLPKPKVVSKNPFRLRRPLDLILQNKFTDVPGGYVKRLLIRAGIKEDKCEICGIEQRRESDNKTPTIMKFLDGNKTNYSIENLQLTCYNCNFLYYDEWSLKKILERTEAKRLRCEEQQNEEIAELSIDPEIDS
jgi:hypothetical protein